MNENRISRQELAGMFDHTCLKPDAVDGDLERLCREAAGMGAAMVAVNTEWTAFCRKQLEGTGVHVGAAVSFPLGQSGLETKLFETRAAIEAGADEIDYVIHIGKAKMHDWAYLKKEMEQIVRICRDHHVVCKVIFETCFLTDDEIENLAKIAKEVRPDFIKTSTGFGTAGARAEHVRLMKQAAGPGVGVKAAGGIRTLDTALEMIAAGADRIGTSSSLKILEEYDQRFGR